MSEGPSLGDRARDSVTGYEGVITAWTEYLGDGASVRVTRANSDGRPESEWFSPGRLNLKPDHRPAGFGDRP